MKGHFDFISRLRVGGWAFDPKVPGQSATVRVKHQDRVLAEGAADRPRPDVAKALKLDRQEFGFDLPLPALERDELTNVVVEAFDGTAWKLLGTAEKARFIEETERRPARSRAKRRYQDFDGKGGSKSHDKLRALQLDEIPGAQHRAAPLAGLSVLDLGCNEGFFCREAVRQGASRVVGIDFNPRFLEAARTECPEATFMQGTWWDIPEEEFDVILFLSAIHYERQQKKLLEKLAGHLTPNGVLILECGVIGDSAKRWGTVRRHDGVKRYPTRPLLIRELLSGYAVREAGKSVDQKGDPIPRFVFHCCRKKPAAILVSGRSRTGKSTITDQLSDRGIPRLSIDAIFMRLYRDEHYAWRPLAERIRALFDFEGRNWGRAAEVIAEDEALVAELCGLIAQEAPQEAELFAIEGQALIHETILARLRDELDGMGVKTWVMRP